MDPELTTILVTFTSAVLSLATYFINGFLRTKNLPVQLGTVEAIARTAVSAADQFGIGRDFTGAEKLIFASDALVAGAKRAGIKLKPEEVLSFIHSALADLQLAERYAEMTENQVV